MSLKERLKAGLTLAGAAAPDALMVVGAVGVSWGAASIYPPAGFIVAGLFCLVAGVLLSRGAR